MDLPVSAIANSTLSTTTASAGIYTSTVANDPVTCRTRFGDHSPAIYSILSCAFCFVYVYHKLDVEVDTRKMELVVGSGMAYPPGTRMFVDQYNDTAVSVICGSLNQPSECWRWKECCEKATQCCQRQLDEGPRPIEKYGQSVCPRTWDGFACWSDTDAGEIPSMRCPGFLEVTGPHNNAFKTCTKNGSWYMFPGTNDEWTDYSECQTIQKQEAWYLAGVVCNSLTIILTVPACIIFLYFRPLRQQQRIRLHLCLMVSTFILSVSVLIWDTVVYRDRMHSIKEESTMHQNSVGCRFLYILTRYSDMSSFIWMLIEGFHLHRLLVQAFSVPKTLIPYYLVGFGFPILPMMAYAIVRGTSEEYNKSCWVGHANGFEWILYTPNLLSLIANMFFLSRIIFIMVRQLEPHPNEPSTFRRAVKAVGVLVPLFGAHFLLFVYRPAEGGTFTAVYEVANKCVYSIEGAIIAIIFCFCNKEVQGHLKTLCVRMMRESALRHDFNNSRSYTLTSHLEADSTRSRVANSNGNNSESLIPLRPIYCPKNDEPSKPKDIGDDQTNGNLQTIQETFDEEMPLNPSKHSS